MSKKTEQQNLNQFNTQYNANTYNPLINNFEQQTLLEKNRKNLKDLIAPAGIDATHTNHLEIVSSKTKYAILFLGLNNIYMR